MAEIENDWLQKFKWPLVLGLLALIFLSLGFFFLFSQQKQPEIEIISLEEGNNDIFVDIEGSIEKPGLYELPIGSRFNDLLIKAGGLSASADRLWVEQNLNLAQELEDGSKIYIPPEFKVNDNGNNENKVNDKLVLSSNDSNLDKKININKASLVELDTLWGIGEKRAQDIVDNRPYVSVKELLDKKVIPQDVYLKIENEISVF